MGLPNESWVTRHRLTVDEYYRMGEAGVFPQGARVELIEGEVIEPEPDIAVLRPRADFYRTAHPGPTDVLLLVEIADSSLVYDRDVNMPLYACSGIPELWLIDLNAKLMTIYRDPSGEIYREVRTTPNPGVVTLSQLAGVSVDLANLFA
jgi:Uma2 family endonuclease